MKLNRNLAIVALLLLAASIWAYRSSLGPTDRFERGQRLLPNLNPDDVAEISIAKGDDTVTLTRGDDGFTVADVHDYPATNQSVNRVLRTLAELELEKRVGTGDDLYRELGLTADAEDMVEVALKRTNGDDMVRLRIGRPFEGGSGSYLRRIDGDGGPAYLSTKQVTLSTDPDTYLDKEIVQIDRDDIDRIEGPDFVVVRGDDGLELEGVPRGRKENASAMNRLKNTLGSLRFDQVFLADDDTVRDLRLQPVLDVRLTDGSGYRLALAERGDEHFLQIAGYHTVDRVSVDRDESETELEDKAAILSRADEINRFNRFHGSWVYRINKGTAEVLGFRKADLVEDAG
ncbi:MAG: DUF4340 domain-containing protein [Holophagae bacterium]|jgi:hypothetical protein